MSKYTIGLKFKDFPYNGYSEIQVNSLNQRISFPRCISGQVTVTGVVINKKVFKIKPSVYVCGGIQVGFPKGYLYKLLKHESK
jgi:hypothetical protein